MGLDFSALHDFDNNGLGSPEAREARDKLLAQGYTIVQEKIPFDTETPQNASKKAKETPPPEASARIKQASQSALRPFLGVEGQRNYRQFYRVACNYHEKYNPVSWQGDLTSEEGSLIYWTAAADEIGNICQKNGNDRFLNALMGAVYDELENEYRTLLARRSR